MTAIDRGSRFSVKSEFCDIFSEFGKVFQSRVQRKTFCFFPLTASCGVTSSQFQRPMSYNICNNKLRKRNAFPGRFLRKVSPVTNTLLCTDTSVYTSLVFILTRAAYPSRVPVGARTMKVVLFDIGPRASRRTTCKTERVRMEKKREKKRKKCIKSLLGFARFRT